VPLEAPRLLDAEPNPQTYSASWTRNQTRSKPPALSKCGRAIREFLQLKELGPESRIMGT